MLTSQIVSVHIATATSHCAAVIMGLAQGHTVVMNDLFTFLTPNYPKNAPQLSLCNPKLPSVFLEAAEMLSDMIINL